MRNFGLFLAIVAVLAILVNAARTDESSPMLSMGAKVVDNSGKPVCYALTEDSVITGCYYANGAWRTK